MPATLAEPLRPKALDIIRQGALLFALAALIVLAVSWAVVAKYEQGRIEVITTQERGYLQLAEQLIQRDYFEITGDLKFVAGSPLLKRYLTQPTPESLKRIQQTFLLMAREYGRYDQIRYIDKTGHEVVRVNYNAGHPTVVPARGLQDKGDRPYFQQAVNLPPGEIYLSPMDLNIENNAIEVPFKPMIRVAAPVFDERGARRGIVVLNFLARNIEDGLRRGIPVGDGQVFMVLNEQGYWLSHPDKSKEFGFMFHDTGRRFESDYPQEWQAIALRGQGVLQTTHGLFVYALIDALTLGGRPDGSRARALPGAGKMHLVMHVPASLLTADSLFKRPVTAGLLIFMLVVIAALAMTSAYIRLSNRQRLAHEKFIRQKTEELAHTDELTGIANRRHFTLLAEREVDRADRTGQPLALLMLDIDHFKRINDRHGHALGDQALKAFCRACEQVLRKTDVFGRVGGEEFAILMPDTDQQTALAVAGRLRDAVAQAEVRGADGTTVPFTVSIGVSAVAGGGRQLDELLSRADAALYQAKEGGRDRVVVEAVAVSPR